MKNRLLLSAAASIFTAAFLCACNTSRNQRTMLQSQTRMNESTRIQEENLGRISLQMRNFQEQYSENIQEISALKGQIALQDRKIQTLANEMDSLKQQLALERQSRQESMDKILQQVAKETAAAINASSRRESSSSSAGEPATPGEFYIYTVESGATLSAIAKAYGVSVQEIMKANRLKNDIIRVGQKLYIPKR